MPIGAEWSVFAALGVGLPVGCTVACRPPDEGGKGAPLLEGNRGKHSAAHRFISVCDDVRSQLTSLCVV